MLQALQQLRSTLTSTFPEREPVIDGALAAVLAGEHVLLLGPPGTAKSALVRALAQAFGGRYFERLVTKFSTPEELFGPISLKALEQDQFTRVTTDKLPEADVAFVDEIFKANSAILNSLLTLLNERIFHNGGAPTHCPLVSLFGASNELPEGKELEALFDRFLLRFEVDYLLRPNHFRAILTSSVAPPTAVMDMQALRAEQAAVEKLPITDATVDALIAIRDACKAEGIVASDRRWKKSLRLVQASAHLLGQPETSPEDLLVLVDCLWRAPKERPKVARLIGQVADPVSSRATEILDAAIETAARVRALATNDRKAYLGEVAKALEDFRAQQAKLTALTQTAGQRAKQTISDATKHITHLHAELARAISNDLGLGGMRVVQ